LEKINEIEKRVEDKERGIRELKAERYYLHQEIRT
jgi:hypothetical protein